MNIGFHSFYQIYNHNRMFIDCSSPIGDDLMYPYVYVGKYLSSIGHRVSTLDMGAIQEYDAIVFLDYPTMLNRVFRKLISMTDAPPLYLIICEPKMLRPDNWDIRNHRFFKKVFTWNTLLSQGGNYVNLPLPNKLEKEEVFFDIKNKERFCTLIASNKYSNYPGELYSERLKIIRWFELHHLDRFDLYGIDWDRFFIPFLGKANFLLAAFYKKCSWLPKISRHKSYKGRLGRKRDTLAKYKFAICFENVVEPGYITEKIFDCWLAGVIPIYWGAPEAHAYFPENTFIDMHKFSSYEMLFAYLITLSDEACQAKLDDISRFLSSKEAMHWDVSNFAKTLEREICHA